MKDEGRGTHHIHLELLKQRVRVLVVACGGNGSAIATGLRYLHQALLAYGHPEGIHVTLLDPDVISPTNCVRQPFSQSEIGLYKSAVLANRLNGLPSCSAAEALIPGTGNGSGERPVVEGFPSTTLSHWQNLRFRRIRADTP